MICDNCGKSFEIGNRPDGLPNGVGFQMKNGKIINICADCLIRLGEMSEREKDDFFKKISDGKD